MRGKLRQGHPAVWGNIFWVSACLLLLSCVGPRGAFAASRGLAAPPFSPGEELTFHVRWGMIPAGTATLSVLSGGSTAERQGFHFVATAKTLPFVDLFYMVRDRIDSYTDHHVTRSLLYSVEKKGTRPKRVEVAFDWERGQATYRENGKARQSIRLLDGAFDPLSVFYAFRFFDLAPGKVLTAAVTDGKKCVQGTAKVLARQTVTVPCGTFDTFVVEPDFRDVRGIFEKSRNASFRIWVSADSRRIPVKVESEVIVGSFVAELVSVGTGPTASPSPGK
jgi:hypothetical protein